MAESALHGLVLCRGRAERIAFLASDVAMIETFRAGMAPHLDDAASDGKLLRDGHGNSLGVNAVEIFGDQVEVLAPPAVLVKNAGGSLHGFAAVQGVLYPVLRLAEYVRFLSARRSMPS